MTTRRGLQSQPAGNLAVKRPAGSALRRIRAGRIHFGRKPNCAGYWFTQSALIGNATEQRRSYQPQPRNGHKNWSVENHAAEFTFLSGIIPPARFVHR